jgi:hypothetical protein
VGEALDHAQSADAQVAAPQEKDLAKGILKAIDVDSYRVEKKAAMKIVFAFMFLMLGLSASARARANVVNL